MWYDRSLVYKKHAVYTACHTFRNGITNGRSGKLVACWSFAWNSSTDNCEFCRRQNKQTTNEILMTYESYPRLYTSVETNSIDFNALRMWPPKIQEQIFFGQLLGKFREFSGKNHIKFGHFVNFSYIFFRVKMLCLPKVDWAPTPTKRWHTASSRTRGCTDT